MGQVNTLSVFDAQPVAMRILGAAAERQRLSHAYLLHGPDGTGKWQAATALARWILCRRQSIEPACDCEACRRIDRFQHPDVHWVRPRCVKEKPSYSGGHTPEDTETFERKQADPWAELTYARRPYITSGQIRELQSELSRTAVEAGNKVGIIIRAENLRQDVQSILLKTIEEPPQDTHLILTTNSRSSLLSTILSRCQPIRFAPLAPEVLDEQLQMLEVDDTVIPLAVTLAGGSLTRARYIASEEGLLWTNTAWTYFRMAIFGTADQLVAGLDDLFKQRPDLPTLLQFADVWDVAINRVVTAPSGSTDGDRILDERLLQSYRRLNEMRTALTGNVTPRVAVAAALLDIQTYLGRFRNRLTDWFPERITDRPTADFTR
jgi:DNA polymerase-3 subunit delta'